MNIHSGKISFLTGNIYIKSISQTFYAQNMIKRAWAEQNHPAIKTRKSFHEAKIKMIIFVFFTIFE